MTNVYGLIHYLIKLIFNITRLPILVLKMIEVDNLSCEHDNNYPYHVFIAEMVVRCDNACLSAMELKCVFREWIRNNYPGHVSGALFRLQELYELITKKFGNQVELITKKSKGWVGIRLYEYCRYETEDCQDEFQTKDCMHETKDCEEKYKHYRPKQIIFKNCIPCEHGQCNKTYCKVCARLCEHGKRKSSCKVCVRISKLCRSTWCHTTGNKKYEGYCVPCFVNNPDNMFKPEMRNYKTKEKEVVGCIIENYPQFTWVADRKVQDGCSLRRPDLLLDMGSHIIIVEVDENKHTGYDCSCENKRLMEISQDLQHRPIVFIRFNPDGYRDQSGRLIKSCWQLNARGVMTIIVSKRSEWDERMQTLTQQIHHWIDNIPEKTIEIIELFY
jgi:hypothetical protein